VRIICECEIEFGNWNEDHNGWPVKMTITGIPQGLHSLVSNAFGRGIQSAGTETPTNRISFISAGYVGIVGAQKPTLGETSGS